MLEVTGWQKTATLKRARSLVNDNRFVDYGVELRVVVPDDDGFEAVPGMQRVRTIRTHRFGGVWDLRRRCFSGGSANPVVWYASPEQETLVLHQDLPLKVICLSAEGAGKTRGVLSSWIALQALRFAGQSVEGGCTAPTGPRLQTLIMALRERMPPSWYSWHARTNVFSLHCGPRLRCLSATFYSQEAGSPIQGWDWVFAAADELSDHYGVNDDIEARLRRAPRGEGYRMNTVTHKDDSGFRNFLDGWESNPLCKVVRLPGRTNPFVSPKHWENLKTVLSEREYKRRVLAEPVASETATYYTFDRRKHLRPIPPHAVDVTPQVLREFFGQEYHLLCGHDPGTLRDVTEMLRIYEMPNGERAWWVVGECYTKQTTTEAHVWRLVQDWRAKGWMRQQFPFARPLVFCDPHAEDGATPDESVMRVFRQHGIEIRSASPIKHRVPKDPGIEMIVSLLENAAGKSRLFINVDDRGQPVAPHLVRALEHSERDEQGRAEQERKSKRYKDADFSDCPAALRYALWRIERAKSGPARMVA